MLALYLILYCVPMLPTAVLVTIYYMDDPRPHPVATIIGALLWPLVWSSLFVFVLAVVYRTIIDNIAPWKE